MKDRLLRKLVPAVPTIARTPLAPMLDIADRYLRIGHPEWSHLPPASLRMRIGVGNQILRNHDAFIEAGRRLVEELTARGYLTPHSSVLELGCGCGRNALAMLRTLEGPGRYVGQDVDLQMVEWCKRHILSERFSFHHADLFSKVYNPGGKPASDYRFPVPDRSVSLIVSVSVFSHLLTDDFRQYARESGRVLSDGGALHMTIFGLDFMRDRLGDRWTFAHRVGECFVENLRFPEAAVAYEMATVEKLLAEGGLTIAEIYHQDRHQQTVIARRR